jgi:hypothetical protein
MTIPRTHVEEEWIGDTSERLRSRGREMAEEAMERGKQVVSAAREAAMEEAEHQGLTPRQMAEKGKAVAQSAKAAGQETLKSQTSSSSPSSTTGGSSIGGPAPKSSPSI